MCGIAGSLSNSHVNPECINSAIKIISHRGPDETGFFLGNNCTLGIARLSIIDVNEGHQPCFSESKDIVSVFNGEIYNFRQLRELLSNKGHIFSNNSDSEIIPHLFEEFGEDFPSKIQGMFAIAIYVKSMNAIYLFRDRMGKKPIWYAIQDGDLHFSSELKGLFPLGVNKEFESSTITEYLSQGYVNAPRSPFKNVFQVRPGSILKVKDGNASSRQYWKPEDIQESDISWHDALNESEKLIRTAVKERLFSERPLGVFLSGGIDSTLIAAIAQQEISNLKTFSIGFLESEFDESNHAALISKHLGTDHYTSIITPNPEIIVEEVSKMLDQPFADSSVIPTYLLSKFAHEQVVVALSGDGGDESFAGYDRYRANHYLRFINLLLKANPMRKALTEVSSESRYGKLLRATAASEPLHRYMNLQSNLPAVTVSRLTGKPFELGQVIALLPLNFQELESNVRNMQLLDFKTYLPGDLLYKVDITSMANGLEVRSPLLDYRVVEFGLSLPTNYKINPWRNKLILRSLLERFVPANLVNRPKKGFGIPRAKWLREELKPLVLESLVTKEAWVNNYLDRKEIRCLVDSHMKGKDYDASIWTLLMLELWAKNWLLD
jgi:asparagine synthase (glutamine-hydrolysing)